MTEFEQALGGFFEAAGVPMPAADDDGVRCFRLDDVDLKLVCRPDAPEEVSCAAFVGSVAEVADREAFFEDVLKANCFWQGTRGGTLGLDGDDGDTLMLSDVRDADELADVAEIRDWLAGFVRTVREWRGYIANLEPGGFGEEIPETDEEVSE